MDHRVLSEAQAWEIFFHPELPSETQGEIINQLCNPATLRALVVLNRSWAARVRVRLDAHLKRGIEYHLEEGGGLLGLNWLGRYTFGSSYFRGTRVRPRRGEGVELQFDGLIAVDDANDGDIDEKTLFQRAVEGLDRIPFADDRILLQLHHPKDILEDSKKHLIAIVTTEAGLAMLIQRLLDRKDGEFRAADPSLLVQKMRTHWERHKEKGAILFDSSYKTYDVDEEYTTFVLLNNLAAFLDELRRIVAIGNQNGVSFRWV